MSSVSPTLIAIETSTELASVALLQRGQVHCRESSGAQMHSLKVPSLLQSLLADAGLSLSQCDAVAFGAGPGSFTGVRTACGLAQGLAFGAQRPVVPVVTLLAMAERARSQGAGDEVLAVLDARMGEVYWAQYRFDQGWQAVSEPRLSAASAVVAAGSPALCGNGLLAYAGDLAHLRSSARMPEVLPHAAEVARLAAVAFADGHSVHARDAQPLYLRNKVALTTQERLAGASA